MSRAGEEYELPDWLDRDWQDDILTAADELATRADEREQAPLEPRDALLVLVVEQLHYIADELAGILQVIQLDRRARK